MIIILYEKSGILKLAFILFLMKVFLSDKVYIFIDFFLIICQIILLHTISVLAEREKIVVIEYILENDSSKY